jgi:putative spermidine/putrescine transport system permease protein
VTAQRTSFYLSRRGALAMLSVYAGLFFTFLLLPIALAVIVSFDSKAFPGFPMAGFSLRWYYRVWEYKPFVDSLIVSIELALASAAVAAVIAIPGALALARSRHWAADALSTFLLSPLSMPMIVLGLAQLYYLSALGFGISFLALLVAHTAVGIPYLFRTVLGVYRGLGPDYEEAAAILGANRWNTFRHVTLPLIRPGIFAGAMFAVLVSFENLPISFFFGSATTNTLPVVMLSYLENQFDPSIAAISTIQMLLAFAALLVVERIYGLKNMNAPT